MKKKTLLVLAALLAAPLGGQEFLRGQVRVQADWGAPLPRDIPQRWALEEAAFYFSAMIYGWSFHYESGEAARGAAEALELSPLGQIPWGDDGLRATDVENRAGDLFLWTDYRLSDAQRRRLLQWRAGTIQNAGATGYGELRYPQEAEDWVAQRRQTLEDAARAAIRSFLRGTERNRPKEARGFLALSGFPVYRIERGRWAADARFRLELTEALPFAAY